MKTILILSAVLLAFVNPLRAGDLPKDFRITLFDGGGMTRQGERIFLSADSSYYEWYDEGADNKLYLSISEKKLEALYEIIRSRNFEDIETYREEVYDRGGVSISVTADGETISKEDGGQTFIQKAWQDNFNTVESEIRDLVDAELEKMLVDFTVYIDKSIAGADKIVNMHSSDLVYMSARDGYPSKFELSVLPGEHYLSIIMMNKEITTVPGEKIFAQADFILRADKDNNPERNSVTLYLDGNVIKSK